MLPAPLLARSDGECGTFELATPVIVGDIAFVETSLHCGPLCGTGLLYALERRDGAWAVLAIAHVWSS